MQRILAPVKSEMVRWPGLHPAAAAAAELVSVSFCPGLDQQVMVKVLSNVVVSCEK